MKKLLMILTILAISLIFVQGSYAGLDDKSDRLSSEQSGVFSPGYINAAMQKTREIINQSSMGRSPIENATESAKDKLSNEVVKDSFEQVTPELKKKTGAASNNPKASPSTATSQVVLMDYVPIGTGTNKVTEGGKLISETIDGKNYVYAGFSNFGTNTMQAAIDRANAGDIIIVSRGTYTYGNSTITINKGIKLFGGYNDSGMRDLVATPTVLGGIHISSVTDPVEINGFTIDTAHIGTNLSDSIQIDRSNSVTVTNCNIASYLSFKPPPVFEGGITIGTLGPSNHNAIGVFFSNVVVANNNIIGGYYGIYSYGPSSITMWNNNISDSGAAPSLGNISYTTTNPSTDSYTTKTIAVSVDGAENQRSDMLQHQDRTMGQDPASISYLNRNMDSLSTYQNMNKEALVSIFKGLLANKNTLGESGTYTDPRLVTKIVEDSLGKSALSLAATDANSREVNMAMTLVNIFKNPTEDQKLILDTIESVLAQTQKTIDQSGSPELKKASDDLLQMVANILIAQAIPDLLKEGDVSVVKNTFADLNSTKAKIFLEYQESTKPYYDEIKKLMSKNMAILQLNNIISKGMMSEDLSKLEPSEIGKILEKLHKASNKSFEEEYILQQEAKYHKQYIEPGKKILEEKMKAMMKDFTQRLSKILEASKK